MPKNHNTPEQRMARVIQKTEGIKYTEALRRVRAWLDAKKEKTDEIEAVEVDAQQVVGQS